MNKKVTINGIELNFPKYDASAVTLFDYLDHVVSHFEDELGEDDGNFQISINVDFSTSKPPRHEIYSNGVANKKTKQKVARILEKTVDGEYNHMSGSVKVNLVVEDKDKVKDK